MCVKTNFSLFLIRKWKSIPMSHVHFSVGFVLETWIYNMGGGGGGGGERKEEEEEEEQQGETELNPFFSWFNKILFLLYLYIVIGGEEREGGGGRGGGAKVIFHQIC